MNRIVTEAMSWLGTPYIHGGNVKGAGADCAMMLIEVYHAAGCIPKFDPRPYPHDWHLHRNENVYLDWLQRYADEVDSPEAGDVVVYKFGRCFSHGAIYAGDGDVIHAYIGRGVVLSNIQEGELAGRPIRFFRVRNS